MNNILFDNDEYFQLNKASLDHLESLKLDLSDTTVFETGAGIGKLTYFFEKLNCNILSTDGRVENVLEHKKRFPHRNVLTADLEKNDTYKKLERFDIIFCYGTLYHLSNPGFAIKMLSSKCKKYFLLETCVNACDNMNVNLTGENVELMDQSLYGIGCRPSRDWIFNELKKYFEFVYISKTQPKHPDFPLNWPVSNPSRLTRAVFIASRIKIENEFLSDKLMNKQFHVIE